MIKILIIEDEIPARKKLRRLLDELDAQIDITAEIDTVAAGIDFLKNNSAFTIILYNEKKTHHPKIGDKA